MELLLGIVEFLFYNFDFGGFGILLLCNVVFVWDCELFNCFLFWFGILLFSYCHFCLVFCLGSLLVCSFLDK